VSELFGLPAPAIAIALLIVAVFAIGSVALVALRDRVLFDIGVRNIGRRRLQSVLIVLGLMLSTAIIASALATGDTVEYSITNETFTRLGHVDQIFRARDAERREDPTDENIGPASLVPAGLFNGLVADLNGNENVDGNLPVLRFPVPAGSRRTERVLPEAVLIGLDPRYMEGFEDDVQTLNGARFNVGLLARNEAAINESMARALGIGAGNQIDLYVERLPRTLNVVAVVKDRMLTGWTRGRAEGVLVSMGTAQFLANPSDPPAGFGFVAISNRGGVRGGLELTDTVSRPIEESLQLTAFELDRIKENRVRQAEDAGRDMAAIFLVLGMFSIAAGLLLVFLILVMLATERRTEMGMSRAIGMRRGQLVRAFMSETLVYSVLAAVLGAALGVGVSLLMTRVLAYIFESIDVAVAFRVSPASIVIAWSLGVVLTFVTAVIAAWRVSNLTVVAALRDLPDPPPRATGASSIAAGVAVGIGGVALLAWGIAAGAAWAWGAGATLALIAVAFGLRAAGQPERSVFTGTGAAVLILWFLIAGGTLAGVTGTLGLETFIVGGVIMVAAATIVVVYNADLLRPLIRLPGAMLGRLAPSVRTAVAYPLSNRFRTGMALAMMSLVFFALVMIATLSLNFQNLFLGSAAQGGWDIRLQESPQNRLIDIGSPPNPHGPLGEALDRAFYDTTHIDAVGQAFVANPRRTLVAEIDDDDNTLEPQAFLVKGVDHVFTAQTDIQLQARARGFTDDREAWQALDQSNEYAIIDGTVVRGINYANVTEDRFTLSRFEPGTTEFQPFPLRVIDSRTLDLRTVTVIGIMQRAPSETFRGLYVGEEAFHQTLTSNFSEYYVRLNPGEDTTAETAAMNSALAIQGVLAESIADEVADTQRLSSAFFYLVQGFMALGLGIGLAALAVIAFRTVVERRQQIGLMRAMGFTRLHIAVSFVLESAFIAVLGIANGTWLALLVANLILSSDEFSSAGFNAFDVPWQQITIMAALVFAASVLTTLIPSRQASTIPIAEALRYE
jgi:putative ABC transport system permease protein